MNNLSHQRGITLIELMAALGVAAVILTITAQWMVWLNQEGLKGQALVEEYEYQYMIREQWFEDIQRAHTVLISPKEAKLVHPEDTVAYQFTDAALIRQELSKPGTIVLGIIEGEFYKDNTYVGIRSVQSGNEWRYEAPLKDQTW